MGSKEIFIKNIAGEITLSEDPGTALKKWREIFGVKQCNLAAGLGISPSVISDYESGRRKSPGTGFVKKYINVLIEEDKRKGGEVIRKFSPEADNAAILDIREFLEPVSFNEIKEAIKGYVICRGQDNILISGYTIIDSIKAIVELSESDFINLYGSTTERALVFTKVQTGRSPMVAIKVTKPKPKMVILHGLHPNRMDPLGAKIARIENIPLMISTLNSESEVIENLRKIQK